MEKHPLILRNSFPQICEFKVRFEPSEQSAGCIDCILELRVSSEEIPLGDEYCEIAFRKLTISVDNEGLDILSNSRYGEPRKNNSVSLTRETKTMGKAKSRTSWKANGSSKDLPTISGSADQESESATTNSQHYREEGHHLRVKARPNDRWEVTEPAQGLLEDTYLCDDLLFSAKLSNNANRNISSLSLKVKQRDLGINGIYSDPTSKAFFGRMGENKKRLLDIFIAKSLSQLAYRDRKYKGEITLSEAEQEFRNED